jgi:hypothetical protein
MSTPESSNRYNAFGCCGLCPAQFLPRAVAIAGSAIVITSLAGMVLGFLRPQDA